MVGILHRRIQGVRNFILDYRKQIHNLLTTRSSSGSTQGFWFSLAGREEEEEKKNKTLEASRSVSKIPTAEEVRERRMASAGSNASLALFLATLDNSFVKTLNEDPASADNFPNRITRPVYSGHYVRVGPTPLKDPFLVAFSPSMAATLGLTNEMVQGNEFVDMFSGNVQEDKVTCWSTPYAVSVYGMPIHSPDQFGGYGYGDGRACSVGEFVNSQGQRWELQLKGGGPTPFSRSFDGRAVLRSSVREFLVSEAMDALGVPTTRALSLVASATEFVPRAWYSEREEASTFEFPPNRMVNERCAITCRAAPSFIRVGHIELFSRRIAKKPEAAKELHDLVRHAIVREFPTIELGSHTDLHPKEIVEMLSQFARRQAHLTTEWIRVGYVQGNMNSDNCLLSGRTMDYGPFGFMEEYDPLWSPFTSDPERKFGFERQPRAAHVNLATLLEALRPLLEELEQTSDDENVNYVEKAIDVVRHEYPAVLAEEICQMRSAKLGLLTWDGDEMDGDLWNPLFKLLVGLDYTIFWRQLGSYLLDDAEKNDDELIKPLLQSYYDENHAEKTKAELCNWVRKWLGYVKKYGIQDDKERQTKMNRANPKYIPREWMLAQAYNAAEKGDNTVLDLLQHIFASPYDEHSAEIHEQFYRKTPMESKNRPGISFYS